MRKYITVIICIIILVIFNSGCTNLNNLNNSTNNSNNITDNSSNNNLSENITQKVNKKKKTGAICSYCGGKGYYMLNLKCNTCNGLGTINGEPCPKCHGSGSQSHKTKVRCEGCRGDGTIEKGDPAYNF